MLSSRSLDQMFTTPNVRKAKRIKVWVNGDLNCYEFSINPREFRTWNTILHHFTKVIQPNFGAIRRLMSLKTNREVWGFEALDNDDRYIGFGSGSQTRLMPHLYKTTEELVSRRQPKVRTIYAGPRPFGEMAFISEVNKKKLTVIYVTTNGINHQTPPKVVFNKRDINNWKLITNYLTGVLNIPEGIGYICTIYGQKIKDASEFQSGYLYVAVPNNYAFLNIDYMRIFQIQEMIQQHKHLMLSKKTTRKSRNNLNGNVKIHAVD